VVHDPSNRSEIAQKKAQAILKSEEVDRIGIGIYYKCEIPTYEDYLEQKGVLRRELPPAEAEDIYQRDITPLLDALA